MLFGSLAYRGRRRALPPEPPDRVGYSHFEMGEPDAY